MKKLRLQAALMVIAIIGITGFQFFWLKQTYDREKRSLTLKTDLAFRNTIQELQVIKFKLNRESDTLKRSGQMKLFVKPLGDSAERIDESYDLSFSNGKRQVISTINVVRKKIGDSLIKDSSVKKGLFITKDRDFFNDKHFLPGSIPPGGPMVKNDFVQILYGVDSLQDSIKIKEIVSVLKKKLVEQNVNIPFTISRDSLSKPREEPLNEVVVGFAHPLVYKLLAGNTLPYLAKQLSMPVLFSVLLLGITILSFIMLYRSLLQQRRLTEIKNEFIGNITHELKTPIATVSVAIEAMRNFNALQDPAKTTEYLGIAGQELNRLSLLVDKVLRLSMFENRDVELKYEAFNFAELVQEVTKSMQLQFEKAKANVSIQLNGLDFTIHADRMHIASVVYNLLDNAIKYSKEDPVMKISITADPNNIALSVADNGVGIDPVYKDRIFDKFFRVPHGNQHNVKGYGLGLSYVAHIIERHHGSIDVKSDGRSGTELIIKLPRTNAG